MRARSTTRTKPMLCPHCGSLCDAATNVMSGRKPSPGSISMCIACGNFMTFTQDLSLRILTAPEFAALPPDLKATLVRMKLAQMAVVPPRTNKEAKN